MGRRTSDWTRRSRKWACCLLGSAADRAARSLSAGHLQAEPLEPRMLLAVAGPVGPEFQFGSTPAIYTDITLASDGADHYVAVWAGQPQQGIGDAALTAQRFDATGHAVGPEIVIDPTTDYPNKPSVAMDHHGDFVVAWTGHNTRYTDSIYECVKLQRFNAAGEAMGQIYTISPTSGYTEGSPAVAMTDDDRVAVVWNSVQVPSSFRPNLYGQLFDSSGQPEGSRFRVNSSTYDYGFQESIATDSNGNFAVAWTASPPNSTAGAVYGRLFDPAGTPKGSDFRVDSNPNASMWPDSTMAMDASGNLCIFWTEYSYSDGTNTDLYGQRYAADGMKIGSAFRVTPATQHWRTAPDAAVLPGGGLVVAYGGYSNDAGGTRATVYDASGTTLVSNIRLNSDPLIYTAPEVEPAAGGFMAVWLSGTSIQRLVRGQRIELYDGPGASVSGRVWHDTNYNGIQDVGESAIGGVTVKVCNVDGAVAGEAVTSADGLYQLKDLLPGSYYVAYQLPTQYMLTSPQDVGADDSVDSDIDGKTLHTRVFTLAPGAAQDHVDAGLAKPGVIQGTVFADADANGSRNGTEPALAGWTVYADLNGNGQPDQGEPASFSSFDGAYTLNGVIPSSITVRAVPQLHWETIGTALVSLASGQTITKVDLAN